MKRLAQLLGLLASLGLGLTACNATVISDGDEDGGGGEADDGYGGNGGNGGAPGQPTTTSSNPPPPSPAISMLRWELDNPPSTGSVSAVTTTGNFTTVGVTTGGDPTTSSVSSGTPNDPNELVIFLGSQLQSCDDPFTNDCSAQSWRVIINLPLSMQQVGTYSLTGLANFSEITSCESGGGGSYWEGTITVTNIDAGQIDFVLSGTSDFFFLNDNADGTYSAPRCF